MPQADHFLVQDARMREYPVGRRSDAAGQGRAAMAKTRVVDTAELQNADANTRSRKSGGSARDWCIRERGDERQYEGARRAHCCRDVSLSESEHRKSGDGRGDVGQEHVAVSVGTHRE